MIRPAVSACSDSLNGMQTNVAPAMVRVAPNPREEHRNRAPKPMRPEAVSQRNPGSLRDSLDLPSLWLESVPCPLVSGLVRPSRHLCSSAVALRRDFGPGSHFERSENPAVILSGAQRSEGPPSLRRAPPRRTGVLRSL